MSVKTDNLTISQAAKLLNVHPNTLRNWEDKKLLLPHRDRSNNYRTYPIATIREFLLRSSSPKIEVKWGVLEVIKARIEELDYARKTLDVMVSNESTTPDDSSNELLFERLEDALARGVVVRFIRGIHPDNHLDERVKRMKQLGVATKLRQLNGFTCSIQDASIVRLEIPSDVPENRMQIIIRDKKVSGSFLSMFELLWKHND
jgi:DNA-binding transcriptional MerR regulator